MSKTNEVPPEPRVEPNIPALIALLVPGGDMEQCEKGQAESMSKTGKLYQRIQKDFRGHRGAVSDIRKMQKMSKAQLADYLRTLEPLMLHFNFTLDDIEPDLVDQSQVVEKPKDDDDDDAGKGPTNGPTSALEISRSALAGAPETVQMMNERLARENSERLAGGKPADEPETTAAKGKAKLGIVKPEGGK